MKKVNSFLLAMMLIVISATSIFIFTGGIKGKSAYQLACENGYTGTLNEWLNDLQGKDGADAVSIDYFALYEQSLEQGEIDADMSYLQFIQDYIISSTEESETKQLMAIQNSLTCSVGIFVFYGGSYVSAGSGTIFDIDSNGNAKIMTNYHVTYTADSAANYYILLYEDSYLTSTTQATIERKAIKASYVGGSKNYDLAVLQISKSDKLKNSCATAVNFSDSDLVTVGAECYAVGNPLGEGMSVVNGIISVAYEQIALEDVTNTSASIYQRAIRTNCSINGGNSGGGLFNNNGELIGVINSKAVYVSSTNNTPVDGMSYAIPINIVKNVLTKIVNQCNGTTVTEPTFKELGITTTILDATAEYNQTTGLVETTETVQIVSVSAGKLAFGKLYADDILLKVKVLYADGTIKLVNINHYFTLSDIMLSINAGDSMEITVNRPAFIGNTYTQHTVTFNFS